MVVLCARELSFPNDDIEGVEIVRVPLDDTLSPSIEEMRRALYAGRIVAQRVRSGKRVLVTCHMGWNRSGLVTGLALREIENITGKNAAEIVQSSRKGALQNSTFRSMLSSLGTPSGEHGALMRRR